MLRMPHGTHVNIVQDGTELYTFDLSSAEDQTFEIAYEGRVNTVQIENGRIRMLEAECPDQTCVHIAERGYAFVSHDNLLLDTARRTVQEVTADDIRLALVPMSKKSEGMYNTVNMLIKCISTRQSAIS